ncbi:glutathione transferase GstA [Maribius pontilimi]|uniref:Glutathione transferase GstA n=1 Tax=Palleronia pontilimi TaxID=1964209 RepID=A0A934IFF3_9RHOB|nr:glutathione transferase GstA [Palleronia pontilimi]MBJ3764646.1 glutathione transferase GstA [Palleronia pontilimi]
MKLYFMPGACSLAPHIALREAGLRFSLVEVDYRSKRTSDGRDFHEINPKGYVPALELNGGDLLTEVPVILTYIDEISGQKALLPRRGSDRLIALEWLNYIATEIHKSFSPLFRPRTPTAFLAPGRAHLSRRLDFVERHLQHREYLLGPGFSLPDIYLFTVFRWLDDQELSPTDWPALQRHSEAIAARQSVKDALEQESLAANFAHRRRMDHPRRHVRRRHGRIRSPGPD